MPPRRSFVTLAALAVAGTVLAVAARGLAPAGTSPQAAAEAWAGLVGGAPAEVDVGQRMIVVLDAPSLAARVRQAGGRAGDREHRRWTASATSIQKLFISRMAVQGAQIRPEFSFTRVLNGFSGPLDPRTIALLERAPEVEGIYPVRAAFPAAISSQLLDARGAVSPPIGMPGFDGRGVTVAVLDTGVDRAQPYLSGRVQEGIDIVGGSRLAHAAPRPDNAADLERHGTQMAGIVVGATVSGSVQGVATAASVLPIRVAGWQRDATGDWAIYGRTDQLIAGLERAVDPNADGDAHDAARIALVGIVERFAGFADGPLAKAAAGALALDTLLVVPAGNEGPKGPGYGSISGPGGAPAALTVGAADLRRSRLSARVVIRAGLNVLLDRLLPLAGIAAAEDAVTLHAATPRLFAPAARPDEQSAALELADFFDDSGFSLVAGKAALVPGGPDTRRVVEEAARAGAAAVLVYGDRIPAGALGLDDRAPIPIVSVPTAAAQATLAALESGASVGVSIGATDRSPSTSSWSLASFSSRGLAFDGRVKPELVAPGVAVPTSEPGVAEDGSPRFATVNGSSAAAATVAGAAALLAQARPDLDAATLKSLLVGSARPLPRTPVVAQGAGFLDIGATTAAELAAQPATLAFGRATKAKWTRTLRVTVRNVSTRALRLRVRIERRGFPAADAFFAVRPARLALRPGRSAKVRITARVPLPAEGGPSAEGALVLQPVAGVAVRVPFAVAFGPGRPVLLGAVRLSERAFAPSDTKPAVLTIQAGSVRTVGGLDEIEPVERLDVELWTGEGRRIGVLAELRDLLPGRYALGLTGRDPAGQLLDAGGYRLRIVAHPTGAGRPTIKTLQFSIK